MRSQIPSCPLPPEQAMAQVTASFARTISPRELMVADTNPAQGRFAKGITHAAVSLIRDTNPAELRGIPAYFRALPQLGLPDPGERRRGWRINNDHAHADRCAPPGRNAGGGAQGQPD